MPLHDSLRNSMSRFLNSLWSPITDSSSQLFERFFYFRGLLSSAVARGRNVKRSIHQSHLHTKPIRRFSTRLLAGIPSTHRQCSETGNKSGPGSVTLRGQNGREVESSFASSAETCSPLLPFGVFILTVYSFLKPEGIQISLVDPAPRMLLLKNIA